MYRTFVELHTRQWAALRGGRLGATVSWVPTVHTANMLWIAAEPSGDAEAVMAALESARYELSHYRKLKVEHPAGEMVQAIESAGFEAHRTLIWMSAGATS
jgi:hypothetical protein